MLDFGLYIQLSLKLRDVTLDNLRLHHHVSDHAGHSKELDVVVFLDSFLLGLGRGHSNQLRSIYVVLQVGILIRWNDT